MDGITIRTEAMERDVQHVKDFLALKTARKDLYQKLKRDNPEGDRQMLKQMAYDLSQQAVKNLKEQEFAQELKDASLVPEGIPETRSTSPFSLVGSGRGAK